MLQYNCNPPIQVLSAVLNLGNISFAEEERAYEMEPDADADGNVRLDEHDKPVLRIPTP